MSYYRRRWRRYYRRYFRRYKRRFKNKFNMNYYNYVANIQTTIQPSKRTFQNADEFNYVFGMTETPFLNFYEILSSTKGFQEFNKLFQYFKIRGYSLKIIPDVSNTKNEAIISHNLPIINYSNTYTYTQNAAHFGVPTRYNTKDSNYAVLCKGLETTYKYHFIRGASGIWQNTKVPDAQLISPQSYGGIYVTTYNDPTSTVITDYPYFILELKLYVSLKCVEV